MNNPLLQSALSYAGRGWSIFPLHSISSLVRRCTCGNQNCTSPGKHPRTEHGFKDATSDPDTITRWWAEWPDANIGIVTGSVSGLVVLDVDPRHGGDVALIELEREHGEMPHTLRSQTGGGGEHLIFSCSGILRGGQHKLGSGLDLKAEGGYIVAPPSLHLSGERYRWESYDVPVAPLPEWIVQMCTPVRVLSDNAKREHSLTVAEVGRVGSALERVSADDYDTWLKVGMALHQADQGGPLGFSLWDVWSKKSEGYAPGVTEIKWRSFSESREEVITLGTVFSFAGQEFQDEVPWPGENDMPPTRDSVVENNSPSLFPGKLSWQPVITAFSSIEEKSVDWLWYPYLPMGRVTILEGDPGQGKSWFSLAMATATSRGWWPFSIAGGESLREPCGVVHLTCEDDPEDTIKKRLRILEADQSRIFYLVGKARGSGKPAQITLADLPILEAAIEKTAAKLVIIDPIQAYLPQGVEMNRAEHVRRVMAAVQRLASEKECAVMIVRHLSKGGKDRAIYKGLGSIDFTAAARSVLVCAEIYTSETTESLPFRRRFAVAQAKNNLAPMGLTIEFELHMNEFLWAGTSERRAEDLLSPDLSSQAFLQRAIQEVKEFLLVVLGMGEIEVSEVQAQAKKAGVDARVLKEASLELGVKLVKGSGGWCWTLPEKERGH